MNRPWNGTEPGDRARAIALGRGNTDTPPGRWRTATAPNDFNQHVKGYHMKKFFITILAALVAGGMVSAMGHVSFPDIPSGHWAGDAVEEIADLGIVIGFPDGTFRGNEAFTRYQMALVITRMLAVIDANMDAELGALRAAMQSMAADLAAQGVRLAAAESAIAAISDDVAGMAAWEPIILGARDGVAANAAGVAANAAGVASNAAGVASNAAGVASNAAAIAANAARIDALEAALAAMPTGMDEAVLRDLQNQLASARVAVDTAQAQAEAAEARANGAYDLALQALAAADANTADLAALNQVVQLLAQRVDGLSAPMPAPVMPDIDLSGIDRNAGEIANIRDFVILLRRDQVDLRIRVADLEADFAAASAATDASLAGLEDRVAALEARPNIEVSGSIALTYQVGRVLGDLFDIDRAYGVNNPRGMGNSAFSTGTSELAGGTSGAGNDPGERAQDRWDITQQTGVVNAVLTLNLTTSRALDGKGSPRGLNPFSSVAVIDIKKGFIADDSSFTTGFEGYVFRVKEWKSTFTPIGASPIVFTFGREVSTSFTPYVFNANKLNGYTATVSAPDFLAFLNPGLQVGYFSNQADGYWRGIRGTMAPTFGDAITLSGGVSFAQAASAAGDKDDVLADNTQTTVWGLDGKIGLLGLLDIAFEYANSSTVVPVGDPLVDPTSLLWVTAKASTDLGFLNVKSLGGNYRALDLAFAGIRNNAVPTTPFQVGQTGFGGEIALNLFQRIDVTAFYDSYTSELAVPPNVDNSGYGVSVGAKLFAGFSLSGFYEMAMVDGTVANATSNVRAVNAGYTLLDGNYATKFGVGIKHDGAADDALISGLNIAAGYERWNVDFTRTKIYANADYSLTVSIVTVTPYVGYDSDSDTVVGTNDFTELRAGTGLSTQALDVFLKPSLQGAVNYRTATYTDARDFTATEFQWSVGITLEEFLLPYSSLSARVGSWTGTNMTTTLNTLNDGISAGRTVKDVDRADQSESVFGYEVTWDYYDLRFAYGVYENTRDGVAASAQAFSIKYTVTF